MALNAPARGAYAGSLSSERHRYSDPSERYGRHGSASSSSSAGVGSASRS